MLIELLILWEIVLIELNDKNWLFDGGSIGYMGLCVKKDKSQSMGVLGYPVARGIVRDARPGEAGLT
jgi:hypothetical protein